MKIAVIGAGIAGLNASYLLAKQGHQLSLYEQAPFLGGLASSFDFDGLEIERFYHFICCGDEDLLDLSKDLGIESKIRWNKTCTGNFYEGTHYPFSKPWDLLRFKPLNLLERLRFAMHVFVSQKRTAWQDLESQTAEQWLVKWIGRHAYHVVWEPLLKIKFGRHAADVSAAWIWHRIYRVASSRKGMFENEQFGFFERGSQTLVDALEIALKALSVNIQKLCGIEQIRQLPEGGFLVKSSGGKEAVYDKVISTLPLPLLAEILETEDQKFLEQLRQFRYIGVLCLLFKLNRAVSPNYWLNVHDKRIAFNGIIEYSNLKPCPNPAEHVVYVPYYMPWDDPRFASKDEDLLNEYVDALAHLNPDIDRSSVLSYRVFRERYAQAVCGKHFGKTRLSLDEHLGGLYVSDSTQLYPEDRSLSGMVRLGKRIVQNIGQSRPVKSRVAR